MLGSGAVFPLLPAGFGPGCWACSPLGPQCCLEENPSPRGKGSGLNLLNQVWHRPTQSFLGVSSPALAVGSEPAVSPCPSVCHCPPPQHLAGAQQTLPVSGEEKKTPRAHMWWAGGNRCCKVSGELKEVFVWGLFGYPLGNFTAEEAGPLRQWPKQYPHCLSSARLGAAGGAEGAGEERFLLPAAGSKPHGGCPIIKTSLRPIKSLGCQVE